MARLARVVVPGVPHHVTQRGNGRARTFFGDEDYALYRDLLAASCRAAEVEIWAWVLMPNHVHLILTPQDPDGLRRALAPVHRRYAGHIHARQKRSGHFWQGRFGAVAMDEPHLAAALRYVTHNPVRARLVERAQDWPWSSARAHLRRRDDKVTSLGPVLDRFPRFADLLEREPDPSLYERLRQAESIGRPLGDEAFLGRLERLTRRLLKPGKRGPKPAHPEGGEPEPVRRKSRRSE
jgi:putative transposase